MTTVDFITALFYEVDEQLRAIPKHPEAHLWPDEVVTRGCCMRSKAEATGLFIGGSRATIGRCFPVYPSGPDSFVSARPIRTYTYRKKQTLFCHRRSDNVTRVQGHGGACCVFPSHPEVTFCLYTEQMSSIFAGNPWHFHALPAVGCVPEACGYACEATPTPPAPSGSASSKPSKLVFNPSLAPRGLHWSTPSRTTLRSSTRILLATVYG